MIFDSCIASTIISALFKMWHFFYVNRFYSDETDSSRRVNWSLAELEYDRLFPSRSSNSPNEMETYTASENNYRAVNTEPSCSMNLGASINEHVLANLTSQLIDDVDSISDIKNIIVSNSMNDKSE